VILFATFVMTSMIHLLAADSFAHTKWIAAAVGVATLLAMDSVYDVTRTPGLRWHSAQALLTGLLVLGIAAGVAPIFLGVALLKMILYITRKVGFARSGERPRPWVSAARLAVGIALPAVIWIVGKPELGQLREGWIVACIAVGEIVDRLEFYGELDVPTPRRQMAMDLRTTIAGRGEGSPYVT
jgi:hypothetical protein